MKYKNVNTGFTFESKSEIKGEGWVKLDPLPEEIKEETKEKPKKRTRNK